MKRQQHEEPQRPQDVFLPGYQPLSWLWSGERALFPSEQSARWALRRLREPLNRESALARHRGHLFVQVERFQRVVEQQAIKHCALRRLSE